MHIMKRVKSLRGVCKKRRLILVFIVLVIAAVFTVEFWHKIKYWFGGTTAAMALLPVDKIALWTGIFSSLGAFFIDWYYQHRRTVIAERAAENGE